MRDAKRAQFHRLIGTKKQRINYAKSDFADYLLMVLMCCGVLVAAYGLRGWLTGVGLALCLFMLTSFVVRHGATLRVPMLARRPQELVFSLIHKLGNLPWVYWGALGLVLVENLLIAATPDWPHHVELMRVIGFGVFYLHLGLLFAYRTYSLFDHLKRHEKVSHVLLQSPWKNVGLVRSSIRFEIVHAYFTGLLTHLVLLAPWYLAIQYLQFSVLFAPVVCAVNLALHWQFLKLINSWFYRDHWLGHNSEFDFLYLHGSHHDAIPVGLIAVAGNGFLEGFLRNVLGYPTPFYNPLMAFLAYSVEVKRDIDFHQFVPGIFPRLPLEFRRVGQHSTHHFGHLEPYGFAIKLDQPGFSQGFLQAFKNMPEEFSNSAALEEELTGFKWDNPRHQWFVRICEENE